MSSAYYFDKKGPSQHLMPEEFSVLKAGLFFCKNLKCRYLRKVPLLLLTMRNKGMRGPPNSRNPLSESFSYHSIQQPLSSPHPRIQAQALRHCHLDHALQHLFQRQQLCDTARHQFRLRAVRHPERHLEDVCSRRIEEARLGEGGLV